MKRVMIEGTIEGRICDLQAKKQFITDHALGEGSGLSQFLFYSPFFIFFFCPCDGLDGFELDVKHCFFFSSFFL